MNESKSNKLVEEYLKNVRQQLPDTFETDDLIEDLRVHIQESLSDRIRRYPNEDRLKVTRDVLEDLGDPQVIADEFERTHEAEEQGLDKSDVLKAAARFVISLAVIIVAAWFVSSIPAANIDFWPALIILFIFVLAEALIRKWQKEES